MKVIIYTAALLALWLVGCQGTGPELEQNADPSVQTLDLGGVSIGKFVFPEGSQGVLTDNGSTLNYNFPDGIVLLTETAERGVESIFGGCYQCKSTCNDGCDVVNLGGNIGCSSCKDGTACTGSSCNQPQTADSIDYGFVDIDAGISLIGEGEFLSRVQNVVTPGWELMMGYEPLKTKFDAFYRELWGGTMPTEEQLEKAPSARVNAFGLEILLKVPADVTAKEMALLKVEDGT